MVAYRIRALMMRYLIILKRDINRVCDIAGWPVFDILIWGFISVWMARDSALQDTALIPLYGMFFWQAVFNQTHMGISVSVMDELYGRNLSSLAACPLTLPEWLCALMLMGILRMLAVLIIGACALNLFFGASAMALGWSLLPIIVLFILSGWSLGCSTGALMLVWGHQATAFIWATWVFTAFSGVFSPIDLLPSWMQVISAGIPMSYPIQVLHYYLAHHTIAWELVRTGLLVNSVYLLASVALFISMFKRAQWYGLSRLETE